MHRDAEIREPCLDLGISKARVDLFVESVDDLGRRPPRDAHASQQRLQRVAGSGDVRSSWCVPARDTEAIPIPASQKEAAMSVAVAQNPCVLFRN